jgi:hypothetical protein
MSRGLAAIKQADVRRIIRAAKSEGAAEVEVRVGSATVVVKLGPSTDENPMVEERREIVL